MGEAGGLEHGGDVARGGVDRGEALGAADLDFHRALVSFPGNATLVHQWQQLEGSIRMSIMYAGVDRATANMDTDRHLEIVEAIATGDEDHAVHVIRAHMMEAAATLTA